MKVSIDKRSDDDILYQGSIIEFEFDDNPPIWDGESWNVDPKYDSWDQVNDLHSKSSFNFPIPEGFSHTNGYIKFEIDVG